MTRSRTLVTLTSAAALALVATATAAQDDSAEMEAPSVEVSGVEYAFVNLPTSVPAGTSLTFRNDGAEIHEIVVNRIADDVTETFEELMALAESGVDLQAEGYIDPEFENPMLLAFSDQTAEGSITLDREGRYVALCYIPMGLETAKLIELGVDFSTLGPETDLADLPPEVQAFFGEVMANPMHMTQGMIQEFAVTAEGTEIGPLPEEAA